MKFWQSVRGSLLAILPELLIMCSLVLAGSYVKSVDNRIVADGAGYYDYLPSIFIRGDFVRSDVDSVASKSQFPEVWNNSTYVTVNGYRADKYFCGVAVLISPFFLVADSLSEPGETGYSQLFETTVLIAALFYVFVGLIFLRLLLRMYGVPLWAIIVTQCFIALGTSMLFYSTMYSTYSHVYSFAAITAFLFVAKRYFSTHSKRDFWWMAIVFGIVLLLRPVNILVVLTMPFIAGSWTGFAAGIKAMFVRPGMLAVGILLTGIIYSVQVGAWYLQTGEFWIDTYADEHFDFTKPHAGSFLFGFRSGVFIYTPILLLGLFGIYFLFRRFSVWTGTTLLASLTLIVLILSSWHDFGYGASFGSRVFIEYYSLLAIPMALLLSNGRWFNLILIPFGTFSIYVSVIQSWQYTHYVLHWTDMDYEKYCIVFLETSPRYQGFLWKPMVYREWDTVESTRTDSVAVGTFSCDTVFIKKFSGKQFLKPGLILIDFDNSRDFTVDDLSLIDIGVQDSASGKMEYYNSPPLFWFAESDTSRHGSYFFDVPALADTSMKVILIRVFTNENEAVLRNVGVTVYMWKE